LLVDLHERAVAGEIPAAEALIRLGLEKELAWRAAG
jgi:hypothetical protein